MAVAAYGTGVYSAAFPCAGWRNNSIFKCVAESFNSEDIFVSAYRAEAVSAAFVYTVRVSSLFPLAVGMAKGFNGIVGVAVATAGTFVQCMACCVAVRCQHCVFVVVTKSIENFHIVVSAYGTGEYL